MTSAYSWLLFLHLAGLGVFLVAHGFAGVAALTRNSALLKSQLLADRVAFPGLGLVLLSGIWLGFIDHAWGRAWIWSALVILVGVSVLMGFWSLPYHRARQKQAEPGGARPVTMSWVGSLALLAILFLMVFKPF